MDGYDVKRWERVQERVKELALTMTVSGSTIEISRTGSAKNSLGCFQDVQQLSCFLDGYDWGRQPLSRPEEPKVVEKVQAKRGPKPKAKSDERTPKFNTHKFKYYKGKGKKPGSMPSGCSWFNHLSGKWLKEDVQPRDWGNVLIRRWPKAKPGPAKVEYVMWKAGDPLPSRIPKGCEWQNMDTLKWYTEQASPKCWTFLKRRWPKKG